MSELTTIARPYAKAAFDFAVEKGNTETWAEMLFFAAQVAQNESVAQLLKGGRAGTEMTEMFLTICEAKKKFISDEFSIVVFHLVNMAKSS